jgi:hypothetical protein
VPEILIPQLYIYQTKINKHKNGSGSYNFFDFVKKMSYYFRYNKQINFIYKYLEYIFIGIQRVPELAPYPCMTDTESLKKLIFVKKMSRLQSFKS